MLEIINEEGKGAVGKKSSVKQQILFNIDTLFLFAAKIKQVKVMKCSDILREKTRNKCVLRKRRTKEQNYL